MKRQIIKIDEEKCNGCGICSSGCPEGAIRMVEGKARLVGELLCDGLGACMGDCPLGAISIEEREAEPYDEEKVLDNIIPKGEAVIKAHLEHLREHGQTEYLSKALEILRNRGIEIFAENAGNSPNERHHGGKCPGTMAMEMKKRSLGNKTKSPDKVEPELTNWPVQLKLINPGAPYFKEADILISADCVPFALGNFHARFLKGKKLVIFCPKLDKNYEEYAQKLTELFKTNDVKSVSVLRMEVPCCGGTTEIVNEALKRSGKAHVLKEYTVSIEGELV